MTTVTAKPVTFYYDGLCPLCSREIAHYQKHVGDEPIQFLDITDPDFDAAGHGLDARRIHDVVHAKVGNEVKTGVDAFIALWQALPAYRWLARLARLPGANGLLHVGYYAFAKVRPWLPRRKDRVCLEGTCRR